MKKIRFTKSGYEKLNDQYQKLLSERRPAVEDLRKARDMGDLSENGYYKAARAKLSSIDFNLRKISGYLKNAVVSRESSTEKVDIGKRITLFDGVNDIVYEIVGDLEADPLKKKISLLSPIGRAIVGKKVGDEVKINIPRGKAIYKITKIF